MSVVLPTFPGPQEAVPRYLDFSVQPSAGVAAAGPLVRRLGNRYQLDVRMPPMRLEPQRGWGLGGRVWLQRLRRGLSEGVIFPWPQLDFVVGAPGVPTVAAAQPANTEALALENCRPGYIWREGQFFNPVVAGRHYLCSVDEEAVTAPDGTVTLALGELLRLAVPEGTALRMDPVIEGKLEAGKGQEWGHNRAAIVQPAFVVTEFAYGEFV